jgi:hypothetical protein
MEAGKRRLAGDTARSVATGEVQDLRREACALKECVADLTLKNRLLKKHDRRWGRRRMRYSASEKLEIIRIVEHSHLPTKRTLDQLGIARGRSIAGTTLSRGRCKIDHRRQAGVEQHQRQHPGSDPRDGANYSELSPCELAVRFTDEKRYCEVRWAKFRWAPATVKTGLLNAL